MGEPGKNGSSEELLAKRGDSPAKGGGGVPQTRDRRSLVWGIGGAESISHWFDLWKGKIYPSLVFINAEPI